MEEDGWNMRFRSLGTVEQLQNWPHGHELTEPVALAQMRTRSTLAFSDSVAGRRALHTRIGYHALATEGIALALKGNRREGIRIQDAWGIERGDARLSTLYDLFTKSDVASQEQATERLRETWVGTRPTLIIGLDLHLSRSQQEPLAQLCADGTVNLVLVAGVYPTATWRKTLFPDEVTTLLTVAPLRVSDIDGAAENLSAEERAEVISLTGGQPDFVSLLLEKLRQSTDGTSRRVRNTADILFKSGHMVADHALGSLVETLEIHPETRDPFERYVRGGGDEAHHVKQRTLPLLCAGWMGPYKGQSTTAFGIPSWFHQGWGRLALIRQARKDANRPAQAAGGRKRASR